MDKLHPRDQFYRCAQSIDSGSTSLKSNVKLFADDTSYFTIVEDKTDSTNIINNDLLQISNWAYNWKMLFNPDPNKPAQ